MPSQIIKSTTTSLYSRQKNIYLFSEPREKRDKYFSWIDGSNEEHLWGWANNEPSLDTRYDDPLKDILGILWRDHCAAMDSSKNYKWKDEACSTTSLRGLCQFKKGEKVHNIYRVLYL